MKKYKFLKTYTLISFLFCIFALFFSENTSQKSINSSLLNPKFSNSVCSILINHNDECIELSFDNKINLWICKKDNIITYANIKQINEFIDKLSNIQSMYKISDNKKDFESLLLQNPNSINVILKNKEGNSLTNLHFGLQDNLTSRISVRADKSNDCYEINNVFSSFLKTDLEYWTIPEIILIKEPINVPLTKENLNTLISLRHGKIHEYSVNKKYKKINSLEIEDSFNQRQIIDFYEEEKEEECIFYTQKLYPNSIENQNSMYELSKWTYDRLFKLLREN